MSQPAAHREETPPETVAIGRALSRIPAGLYVLTAAHEDRRMGMLVAWVQQVCFEPPMITVAVAKGRPIMPLISESRCFGICQVAEDDKMLRRKFRDDPDPDDDAFLGYDLAPSVLGGVPLLRTGLTALECELSCHMDVEGDHDLFVGRIHAAFGGDGQPLVSIRDDGFAY
ncbi:MAG: flavin reductase family protein [Planctomycetota bacterium]